MPDLTEEPWDAYSMTATSNFALRCAEISTKSGHPADPLRHIMVSLMTELWDRNFSQTEIRAAFEDAISDLPRYAAGQERRSETSTVPFTHF
jgi:hypothetical protein